MQPNSTIFCGQTLIKFIFRPNMYPNRVHIHQFNPISANVLGISKLYTRSDQMMTLHTNQVSKPFKRLAQCSNSPLRNNHEILCKYQVTCHKNRNMFHIKICFNNG